MPELTHPLLIAITDRRLLKLRPEDWACEAIEGGVDLIQVREKDLSESELVEFASRILEGASPDCERNLEEVCLGVAWGRNPRLKTTERFLSSTPSFSVSEETSPCAHGHSSAVPPLQPRVQLNNALNIARLLSCGLHLPESEPIPDHSPHPLSRSVHSIESAQRSTGFDFLIAGHVFATPSKSGLAPRGLDWLASIAAGVQSPVIAIGGINAGNAAFCIERGASGVAVISAISASDDPCTAARQLRTEIDRAWEQRHG